MPPTRMQHIQDLQKSLDHLFPLLTQMDDYELGTLLKAMNRSYNHILVETGYRHPLSK
jgi:hypothetical protein